MWEFFSRGECIRAGKAPHFLSTILSETYHHPPTVSLKDNIKPLLGNHGYTKHFYGESAHHSTDYKGRQKQ